MVGYEKNKLHKFSRFAQSHTHGVISDQFDNVFININDTKEDEKNQGESWIYTLKENGKIAKGRYEDDSIERLSRAKYFVYDHISTTPYKSLADLRESLVDLTAYQEPEPMDKIFNVARVENKADNPYIRFRIFGGPDKGLQIGFSRFSDNAHILNF